MQFAPNSISGKRLTQYGISSKALKKTHVYSMPWQPMPALTIPVPFSGSIILIRRDLLDVAFDGELTDSPSLAPLVHRFCHAHQRLEWGLFKYLWRHLMTRIYRQGVSLKHRHTERECYQAERLVIEHHEMNAHEDYFTNDQ